MTANVSIPDMDYNLPAIAETAGNGDDELRWVLEDRLYVEGVTQDALDAALAAYVHADFVSQRAMEQLRNERNKLLSDSDWTQASDVTLDNKVSWATYRQTLRDLPANTADPASPSWPTKPE